jgi:predicted membrane chloride channel (bestrophin family)
LKQEHGFNDILREQVGLKLVGIVIAQYDPADKAVLEATNKEAIAKLLGLAQVAEAQAYATQLQIRTGADRDRLIELAKGREALIKKTVEQMQATNASPEAIAHVVGQILKAESVSNSQISSWVEAGGNAFPTFPIR